MLIIRHNRHWYEPRLPHLLFIDNVYVGTMQGDEAHIEIPSGEYNLRVQFGGSIPIGKKGKSLDLSVSATQAVEVSRRGDTLLSFHDRERIWNILFDIDLVVWIVSFFITMPATYKIISNVFFAVWLIRLVIIRKRYYRITQHPQSFDQHIPEETAKAKF